MWNPWTWAAQSNDVAVANARAAATELSRRRIEHHEAELFLEQHLQRVSKTVSA